MSLRNLRPARQRQAREAYPLIAICCFITAIALLLIAIRL